MIELRLQPYISKLKPLFNDYCVEQGLIQRNGVYTQSEYYRNFTEWLHDVHHINVRFGTFTDNGAFIFQSEAEKNLFLLKWG